MATSRFGWFPAVQPWLSTAVRVAAGVIMIVAGVAKMVDIPASIRAVRAYRILPEEIVPTVGTVLPFIEIFIGFVLIFGILTRWAAAVYLLMLAGFLIGLIWAWAKGLQIDCGCFGGGGDLANGEEAQYWGNLWERLGFIALGAWLVVFPHSKLSVDALLFPKRERAA